MTKKIVAAVLAISMLLLVTGITAFAAGTATVSAGSGSADVGGTVTITVSLSNNTGLTSVSATVTYDSSKLQVTSSGRGGMSGSTSVSSRRGSASVSWSSGNLSENNTSNAALASLTFKVLDAAQPGETLALSVSASGQYNDDGTSKSAAVSASSGSITVSGRRR